MSYLRYWCLFANSFVQDIVWIALVLCVFALCALYGRFLWMVVHF